MNTEFRNSTHSACGMTLHDSRFFFPLFFSRLDWKTKSFFFVLFFSKCTQLVAIGMQSSVFDFCFCLFPCLVVSSLELVYFVLGSYTSFTGPSLCFLFCNFSFRLL